MYKALASLLVPIFMLLTPLSAIAAEYTTFDDVNEGNSYYVAIKYLKNKGIIIGYENNTFRPSEDINRAEALKMITLATGIFEQEEIESMETTLNSEDRPFTDTPMAAWYTKYLIAAKEKGIISGYGDDSFRPDRTINLAEALKIFLESHENITYPDQNEFQVDDTPAGHWFSDYTAYALEKGLINVYSNNTVNITQDMTRGYLAEIIYRKFMSDIGYHFGKATFYGAAVQGNYTASGEIFDYNLMTAAHKTLPFGSMVEVTNLANGKSVVVKINDRGPYGPGRVIDLSTAAFQEIAWTGTGIINVQYKVIGTE